MERKKSKLLENIILIAIAIGIFWYLSTFVFMRGVVDGNSMHGTYEDGEKCLSFYYDVNNIQRFDTVTFYKQDDKKLIKRIIGLPNETVEYIDNKLYINGRYIEEPFLKNEVTTEDFKCTLKEDEYFCMGDNRNNSSDSRSFGPVSKEKIIGTHLFIFSPLNKMGFYK